MSSRPEPKLRIVLPGANPEAVRKRLELGRSGASGAHEPPKSKRNKIDRRKARQDLDSARRRRGVLDD